MTVAERLVRIARAPIPPLLRRRIRLFLFRWLDLAWALPTGVRLRVSSYGDWIIYNEIFVSGEYDEALRIATAALPATSGSAPFEILDLGANVGFFTLRAVDFLRRHGDAAVRITAVECDAYALGQLRARVLDENGLSERVRIVEGAVGARSGVATLFAPASQVPFVDLEPLFEDSTTIHLLKCDIEGAEELFLRSYAELMRRVRVAIFELHDNLCDVEACRTFLESYGFAHQAVLRTTPPTSIVCVWR